MGISYLFVNCTVNLSIKIYSFFLSPVLAGKKKQVISLKTIKALSEYLQEHPYISIRLKPWCTH